VNDEDWWTTQAMLVYGGSFVEALARAARLADHENLERIKAAFPDYWNEYEEFGKKQSFRNRVPA
jgi:hypothetical protein